LVQNGQEKLTGKNIAYEGSKNPAEMIERSRKRPVDTQ